MAEQNEGRNPVDATRERERLDARVLDAVKVARLAHPHGHVGSQDVRNALVYHPAPWAVSSSLNRLWHAGRIQLSCVDPTGWALR